MRPHSYHYPALMPAGLRFLAFVLFLLGASATHADDFIVARSLLEDKAGTLTLDDVLHADFQPIGQLMTKGYTDSTFWLRIVVRVPKAPTTLELRIRPTYLDEVRLYEPAPQGWNIRVTGDRYPYAERDRAAITLGFVVHPEAEETTYYLRLRTTSTSMLHVEALTPHEAQHKEFRLILLHAGFLAVMLWLLASAAYDYILHRHHLTAWFLLYVASHLVYVVALNGYFAPLVPTAHPEWADVLTSIAVCSGISGIALFQHPLLRPYGIPPVLLGALRAALLTLPIGVLLIGTGHVRIAMESIAASAFALSLLVIVLPWLARCDATPSRRVLRAIFGVQTLTVMGTLLPVLGLMPATDWTFNNAMLHALASALLMFYLLSLRSRMLAEQGMRNTLQLAVLKETLQIERKRKEEQGRFMAMLVHELKTPISVIRMALGLERASEDAKHHANQALRDMNAIVERCRQTDQLEHAASAPRQQACSLPTLLEEACRASGAAQRFVIETAPVPDIASDPQLLRTILANLADNALKYSASDSPIRIHLGLAASDGETIVQLRIENRPGNAGLPDPAQVFRKYYRSPHAHHQSGSGLGLYLVRGFAEQLGGHVKYESVEGNARFTLCLPC